MAVKARPKPVKEPDEPGWTFPPDHDAPPGGDRRFAFGSLKGKTFIDVTLEHPEQYFTTSKSKTLSKEATEYVDWVTANFDVDRRCKPDN